MKDVFLALDSEKNSICAGMCHVCFIQLLEKRDFTPFEVYPSQLSAGTSN